MKKDIFVRRDIYFIICAAYLTIPIVIFLAGNLKLYIGIPAALAMIACAVFSCRDFCKNADKKLPDKADPSYGMKMPLKYLIVLAVVSLIPVFVSGVGEYI